MSIFFALIAALGILGGASMYRYLKDHGVSTLNAWLVAGNGLVCMVIAWVMA